MYNVYLPGWACSSGWVFSGEKWQETSVESKVSSENEDTRGKKKLYLSTKLKKKKEILQSITFKSKMKNKN